MAFNTIDNKYYGYIYKIYNTKNDKIYIGQTRRELDVRWNQHLLTAKKETDKNTVLYKAMNKYGIDKFKIELIQEYSFASKNELIKVLNEEEIRYISEYNSVIPNGYNMQHGGKSATESLKCPVDQYSLNGELLNSYESISEACFNSTKKLNHVHISECCNGKLHTSGGYVWRYKGDRFDKYEKSDKRFSSVDQYSKNGEFIGRYKSFADAVYCVFKTKDNKKYSSHMAACCKGERKTAYGFVWRYEGDSFEKYAHITVKR